MNANNVIRILLFGETGVGKSTWINAFANYLKYQTFVNAQKSPLISLIPTKFSITDSNYNEQIIEIGCSENESFSTGESSTQEVQDYILRYIDKTIHIIDTPGIGDTRGAEKDSENLSNILSHISQFKELHGICVLLKPNSSRLTVMFKYCINELLTHLHKSAANNIVFCFTNARSTFYKPGDTFALLKNSCTEIMDLFGTNISLGINNVYCMDNEGYRLLCCLQNGISFSEDEKENYQRSWDKSASEVHRLIGNLSTNDVHAAKDTVALFQAKKGIHHFTRLQQSLDEKKNDYAVGFQELTRKLTSISFEIVNLQPELSRPETNVKIIAQNYKTTVCTSPKCTAFHYSLQTRKTTIIYKSRCHEGCFCAPTSTINTMPSLPLQRCQKIGNNLICTVCRCAWNLHMSINYKQEIENRTVLDPMIHRRIMMKREEEEQLQIASKKLSTLLNQTRKESEIVSKMCQQFALILKMHSIIPYNNAKEDYLKMNITECERESKKTMAAALKIQLEAHMKEKSIFSLTTKTTIMSAEEISLNLTEFNSSAGTPFIFNKNSIDHIFALQPLPPHTAMSMRLLLLNSGRDYEKTDTEFINFIYQSTKECQFEKMEDINQEMAILLFIHGLKNEELKKHLLSLPKIPNTVAEIQSIVNSFIPTKSLDAPKATTSNSNSNFSNISTAQTISVSNPPKSEVDQPKIEHIFPMVFERSDSSKNSTKLSSNSNTISASSQIQRIQPLLTVDTTDPKIQPVIQKKNSPNPEKLNFKEISSTNSQKNAIEEQNVNSIKKHEARSWKRDNRKLNKFSSNAPVSSIVGRKDPSKKSNTTISNVPKNEGSPSTIPKSNEQQITSKEGNKKPKSKRQCWYCGSQKYHIFSACVARNEVCQKCNSEGHIAEACHINRKQPKSIPNNHLYSSLGKTFVNQSNK